MTDGVWEAVDEEAGLFSLLKVAPSGWNWRTAVLRLGGDDLAVVGPTRGLGDDAHRELARLGRPTWLVAQNHFHHMGIPEWRERYPDAKVVAADGAAVRVSKKSGALVRPPTELPLPAHARILVLDRSRSGELWLSVETTRGRAWVVGDAFFNLPQHATGFQGVMLRVFKTTGGLRIGSTFLLLAVADGAAYARWLRARIDAERPSILVPAHGDVLVDADLTSRLHALANERLPPG